MLIKRRVDIKLLYSRWLSGKKKKNLPAMQEMQVQFLVRKIPRGGTGNPLQYSCLKNPMDKGA